jgi:hypothetical protein
LPGNCFAPFHWNDLYGEQLAINAVTCDAVDPTSLQPAFKHCAVALERVAGERIEALDLNTATPSEPAAMPTATLSRLLGLDALPAPVLAERTTTCRASCWAWARPVAKACRACRPVRRWRRPGGCSSMACWPGCSPSLRQPGGDRCSALPPRALGLADRHGRGSGRTLRQHLREAGLAVQLSCMEAVSLRSCRAPPACC